MPKASNVFTLNRPPGSPPPAAPRRTDIERAHLTLVSKLMATRPQQIVGQADATDLKDRADHLGTVLGLVTDYVGAVVTDTFSTMPDPAGHQQIEAYLSSLASEVIGQMINAADQDSRWRA